MTGSNSRPPRAQVSVVGEMTATRLEAGDLLIVSAGPGADAFSTVVALASAARRAGARVAAFTSRPAEELEAHWADVVVSIPAQTLGAIPAQTTGACIERTTSVLPMGSAYELALQLCCDCACLLLGARLAIRAQELEARHTNLE